MPELLPTPLRVRDPVCSRCLRALSDPAVSYIARDLCDLCLQSEGCDGYFMEDGTQVWLPDSFL